jgi:hypothetical protein
MEKISRREILNGIEAQLQLIAKKAAQRFPRVEGTLGRPSAIGWSRDAQQADKIVRLA